MKYDTIPNSLFIKNRKKFMAQMKPKSIAIFNSNDVYPIGADATMPFEQHRDIFYLSGADQEETILVLFPDAMDKKHREVLFVRETNAHIAVWEGEKLTKERATEVSGIETIYWLTDFDKVFFDFGMPHGFGLLGLVFSLFGIVLPNLCTAYFYVFV